MARAHEFSDAFNNFCRGLTDQVLADRQAIKGKVMSLELAGVKEIWKNLQIICPTLENIADGDDLAKLANTVALIMYSKMELQDAIKKHRDSLLDSGPTFAPPPVPREDRAPVFHLPPPPSLPEYVVFLDSLGLSGDDLSRAQAVFAKVEGGDQVKNVLARQCNDFIGDKSRDPSNFNIVRNLLAGRGFTDDNDQGYKSRLDWLMYSVNTLHQIDQRYTELRKINGDSNRSGYDIFGDRDFLLPPPAFPEDEPDALGEVKPVPAAAAAAAESKKSRPEVTPRRTSSSPSAAAAATAVGMLDGSEEGEVVGGSSSERELARIRGEKAKELAKIRETSGVSAAVMVAGKKEFTRYPGRVHGAERQEDLDTTASGRPSSASRASTTGTHETTSGGGRGETISLIDITDGERARVVHEDPTPVVPSRRRKSPAAAAASGTAPSAPPPPAGVKGSRRVAPPPPVGIEPLRSTSRRASSTTPRLVSVHNAVEKEETFESTSAVEPTAAAAPAVFPLQGATGGATAGGTLPPPVYQRQDPFALPALPPELDGLKPKKRVIGSNGSKLRKAQEEYQKTQRVYELKTLFDSGLLEKSYDSSTVEALERKFSFKSLDRCNQGRDIAAAREEVLKYAEVKKESKKESKKERRSSQAAAFGTSQSMRSSEDEEPLMGETSLHRGKATFLEHRDICRTAAGAVGGNTTSGLEGVVARAVASTATLTSAVSGQSTAVRQASQPTTLALGSVQTQAGAWASASATTTEHAGGGGSVRRRSGSLLPAEPVPVQQPLAVGGGDTASSVAQAAGFTPWKPLQVGAFRSFFDSDTPPPPPSEHAGGEGSVRRRSGSPLPAVPVQRPLAVGGGDTPSSVAQAAGFTPWRRPEVDRFRSFFDETTTGYAPSTVVTNPATTPATTPATATSRGGEGASYSYV